MQQASAATAFAQTYFDLWLRHFPELGKRGCWDVATHLCVDARRAAVRFATLHGVCRGRYGTDESTLRQRLLEMVEAELCRADPADAPVGARTVFTATPTLAARFDAQATAANAALRQSVVALGERPTRPPAERVDDGDRGLALAVVQRYAAHSDAALAAYFADQTVGPGAARIEQLQQRVRSIPHGTLLRLLLARALAEAADQPPGVAAEELAFRLYERTGQGAETTRDHLADFGRLGVVERVAGPRGNRMLFLRLAPRALPYLRDAATAAGRDMRHLARAAWRDADDTINVVPMRRARDG